MSWMGYVHSIFQTISILLNGVSGKQLICKRGVRLADSLSLCLDLF
jgi:hypothetical protein